MSQVLTAAEVANLIGVDEVIVRHTLERRDDELAGYLGRTNANSETPVLALEGLPMLITKLAFNISPTDIIENLACQILHLMLIQNENKDLTEQNKALQKDSEALQRRVEELEQQVVSLQAQLTDATSKKRLWDFFK